MNSMGNALLRWSFFLAFVLVCWPAFAQVEAPDNFDGITVFADTKLLDKNYGAAIHAEMSELSLEDLRKMKAPAGAEADVLPKAGSEIEVTVVVPKGSSPEEIKAFQDAVVPPLKDRFATNKVTIKLLEIDIEDVSYNAKISNAAIDHALQLSEPDRVESNKKLAEAFKAGNNYTVKVWNDWKSSFAETVKRVKTNPESKSLAMASILGLISTSIVSKALISTTGLNKFGIAQSLFALAYDQLNSTLSTRFVKWQVEHRFPLLKHWSPVKFYNGVTMARGIAANFVTSSLLSFELRCLAYLSSTPNVASPYSIEFLTSLGGMNMVGSALSAGTDVGVKSLGMKGYISSRTEILLNSTFNLLQQINNAMIGTGATEFLAFGLAVEWVGRLGVIAANKILPAKTNRIVVVHPELATENAQNKIKYLTGVDLLITKDGVTPEKLRELTRNVDADGKVLEEGRSFYKNLGERMDGFFTILLDTWYRTCRYLKANLWGPPFREVPEL